VQEQPQSENEIERAQRVFNCTPERRNQEDTEFLKKFVRRYFKGKSREQIEHRTPYLLALHSQWEYELQRMRTKSGDDAPTHTPSSSVAKAIDEAAARSTDEEIAKFLANTAAAETEKWQTRVKYAGAAVLGTVVAAGAFLGTKAALTGKKKIDDLKNKVEQKQQEMDRLDNRNPAGEQNER
jgi:hypothetical protein